MSFGTASGTLPIGSSLAIDNSANALFFDSRLESSTDVAARAYRRPSGASWDSGFAVAGPTSFIGIGGGPLHSFDDPEIRLDAAGNAFAIYTEHDFSALSDRNFTSHVFVRRRDPASGSWSAATTLESVSGAYTRSPNLVVEPGGIAWAVWTERTFKDTFFASNDRYAVFASKWNGSVWSTPEKITGDLLWKVSARVASDKHGNPRVLIAWNSDIPLESTLYFTSRSASGSWSALIEIAHAVPVGGLAPVYAEYDLAVDSDDNALAVWREYDGSEHVVLGRHFTSLGGWERAELLSDTSLSDANSPQLAMDPAGNAFLVYQQSDAVASMMIVAVRFEKGRGWVFADRISSFTGFGDDASLPRIAFDGSGNAVAVWIQFLAFANNVPVNHTVVRANVFSIASGWREDETISGSLNEATFQPDVAVSAAGDAIAVWWQGTNQFQPWSASRPSSAGF